MSRPAEVCEGGGEGMGAIEKTIQALADQVGSACQVVAICGRNKGLIKRLEAKQFPAGMQVQHASIPACSPGAGGGAPHAALKVHSALGRLRLQAYFMLAMLTGYYRTCAVCPVMCWVCRDWTKAPCKECCRCVRT